MSDETFIYAVRRANGQWFRAVGYGGGGAQWVTELSKAKTYARLAQARARVTFFAKYMATPPVIVEFTLVESKVIDEAERVAAALSKKSDEKKRREEEARLRDVGHAKAQLKAAKARIKELERAGRGRLEKVV